MKKRVLCMLFILAMTVGLISVASVTAVAEEQTDLYTATVEPSEFGTATVSPTTYSESCQLTITVTPKEGYSAKEVNIYSLDGVGYGKADQDPNDPNVFTIYVGSFSSKLIVSYETTEATWGTNEENLTFSGTLDSALKAAKEDDSIGYIRLYKDVEVNGFIGFYAHGGEFVFDFNGFTITNTYETAQSVMYLDGANITFVDTVGGGGLLGAVYSMGLLSGKIEIYGGNYGNVNANGCDLTVNGGTFSCFIVEEGSVKFGDSLSEIVFQENLYGVNFNYISGTLDVSKVSGIDGLGIISRSPLDLSVEDCGIILPDGYAFYDSNLKEVTSLAPNTMYTVRSRASIPVPKVTGMTINTDSPAYNTATNTFTVTEDNPLVVTVTGENMELFNNGLFLGLCNKSGSFVHTTVEWKNSTGAGLELTNMEIMSMLLRGGEIVKIYLHEINSDVILAEIDVNITVDYDNIPIVDEIVINEDSDGYDAQSNTFYISFDNPLYVTVKGRNLHLYGDEVPFYIYNSQNIRMDYSQLHESISETEIKYYFDIPNYNRVVSTYVHYGYTEDIAGFRFIMSDNAQIDKQINVLLDPNAPPVYNIYTSIGSAGGTVNTNYMYAPEGTTVTAEATPYYGYVLDTISVKDLNGNSIPVTGNTFVMPAREVKVEATFKVDESLDTIVAWRDTDNDGIVDEEEETFSSLCAALEAGGRVKMYADYDASAEETIYVGLGKASGFATILDLNGKNIITDAQYAILISGANMTITGEGSLDTTGLASIYTMGAGSVLNIEGGEIGGVGYVVFGGGKASISGGVVKKMANYITDLVITGGSFTEDPSEYLAEDYIMKKNPETGYYDVEYIYEASVTTSESTEEFLTLAEAIASAKQTDGAVVTLLKNITVEEVITIDGGKFTLDLNGKAVKGNCSIFRIKGTADVKIIDSGDDGAVIGSSPDAIVIGLMGNAKLEIAGGTFEHVGGNGVIGMSDSGKVTAAQLIVSGGTVNGNGVAAINAFGALVKLSGGVVDNIINVGHGVLDLSEYDKPEDIKIASASKNTLTVGKEILLPEKYLLADDNLLPGNTLPPYSASHIALFHNVKVSDTLENGTVTADKELSAEGDTVTLNVKADDGYELKALTITDANGNDVEHDGNTFIMPAGEVKVDASFALIHTHDFGNEWRYNGTEHWQECECGENQGTDAHSYKDGKCTVCKAEDHDYTAETSGETTNETDRQSGGVTSSETSPEENEKDDSGSVLLWIAVGAVVVVGAGVGIFFVTKKKRK